MARTRDQKRRTKKYNPKNKHVLMNPVGFVLEGMAPVSSEREALKKLRWVNHTALDTIRLGFGGKAQVTTLIEAFNISTALCRLGIGQEGAEIIEKGLLSVQSMMERARKVQRCVFTGEELSNVCLAMTIHDEQFEICRLGELEKARLMVLNETKHKKVRVIETTGLEMIP